MSLSFSFSAFTAFFRLTLACAITSSISLPSSPVSSTSSPSSSSSSAGFLLSSTALPLLSPPDALLPFAAPPEEASLEADCAASCCAAEAWAWELRSSILASPKMLWVMSVSPPSPHGLQDPTALVKGCTHIQVLLLGLL